ncbi:hypothetical protein MUP77_00300 [Candidatus Bathyarchaeota archaeon]|nr:hypothetical protein [Candidatus Bathyarchaeota archaeon]
MNNENEEIEENFYSCQYCSMTFDSSDQRDEHVFQSHMHEVQERLSQIRTIAEENKETISEWKAERKKELLLKIATERPQLLHEIQTSPHADEMLDKEIEMDLFKRALHTNSLDSFSAMWIQHPRFEEIYRASIQKPAHEPRSGDSTGQTEEFFESPDAMIDTTKRTNVKENLSDEQRNRQKLVLILTALMRKRKA